MYEPYLEYAEVQKGLVAGEIFQGLLRVNPKRRKVAYVTCLGIKIDVFIENEELRNRAIHGDTVAVALLPQSEWLPVPQKTQHVEAADLTVGAGGAAWTEATAKGSPDANADDDNDDDRDHVQKLWQPRAELLSRKGAAEESASAGSTGVTHPVDVLAQQAGLQPKGKVVYVLQADHAVLHVGAIEANCALHPGRPFPESEHFVKFKPADARYPHCILPRMQLPAAYREDPYTQQRHIFLAEIVAPWAETSKMPHVTNVRSVGETGSIQAETEALLVQNGLNHGYFTDEQLHPLHELLAQVGAGVGADAAAGPGAGGTVPWAIPEDEIARRRDLRGYRIFTIDPPNAKDLDDALHITPLADGATYEIGVHIADVSYFLPEVPHRNPYPLMSDQHTTHNHAPTPPPPLRPALDTGVKGTDLDAEALHRATSVYLVQKVIPMLPPILCEQLCSLNPNVDRLAFSCIWKMRADGTLVDEPPFFGRTVIRSCAKLDYPTAQRMVDGLIPSEPSAGADEDAFLQTLPEDVWEARRRPAGHKAWECARDVWRMHGVAMARRKLRLDHGALVLTKPKTTFTLDAHGNPAGVATYTVRDSNKLVEEYMLLANYLVAQELLLRNGKCAFLRNHPPPKISGLEDLKALAERIGVEIDITSAKALQHSLKNMQATSTNPVVTQAVTALLLHPMNLAKYLAVGDSGPQAWCHYALSIPYYTHFTSPIRRYADVVVHRLLDLALRDPNAAATQGEDSARAQVLAAVATQCNEMRVAAKAAQERSDRVFLAVYLQVCRALPNPPLTDIFSPISRFFCPGTASVRGRGGDRARRQVVHSVGDAAGGGMPHVHGRDGRHRGVL